VEQEHILPRKTSASPKLVQPMRYHLGHIDGYDKSIWMLENNER
jgi:hypothetical protein